MIYKLYEEIKEIIKENYKILIAFFITLLLFTIELPYYIEAPGGIIDIRDRIKVDDSYDSEGSLNMAYVREYKATIPTILIAKFNKNWEITKKETGNPTTEEDIFRNKILLEEANQNALKVAYTYASRDINTTNTKIYVTYVLEEAHTEFQIGDQIIEFNGVIVNSKEELKNVINDIDINNEYKVKVINDGHEFIRNVKFIEYEGTYILGVVISEISDINVTPNIEFNFSKSESGPSGGLMMSLAIYDALTSEDITNGLKIVGTGTIDSDGKVGDIAGVKYKIMGAEKADADVFLVPSGRNYKEALDIKKTNDYDIDVVAVSSFEEALNYLKSN